MTKVSDIKKSVEIASLLEKRKELLNNIFLLHEVKHGKLVLIFGRDEYIFPFDEDTKNFIQVHMNKINVELDEIKKKLQAFSVEEDVEW